jgi:outer membrane autotransporter protein
MRTLKLTLLAAAGVAALSSSAFAADLLAPPPAAAVVETSPDWNGGYIGAFIAGDPVNSAFGLGVDLGVNELTSGLLFGGELEGTWYNSGVTSAQITGKLGTAFGDSAIGYIYSGIGTRSDTSTYAPLGVGVEFKLADNLGLKTEAQYNFDLSNSAENSAAVKVGLNWHF